MSLQAARAERAMTAPAPLRRPIAPRRVSGPVLQPRAAQLPSARHRRSAFARLLDAPFLDKLLRGRLWIGIVAFALLGIVAMQVAILRLGASIGASVTRIQQLEQANQNAATGIARLEPSAGVASEATKLGMLYPPAGNVVYLHSNPADVQIAAASITRPTAPLVGGGASSALTAPLSLGSSTTVASTTGIASSATGSTTQPAGAQQQSTTTPASDTTPAPGGSTQAPPVTSSPGNAVAAGGGSAAPSVGGG